MGPVRRASVAGGSRGGSRQTGRVCHGRPVKLPGISRDTISRHSRGRLSLVLSASILIPRQRSSSSACIDPTRPSGIMPGLCFGVLALKNSMICEKIRISFVTSPLILDTGRHFRSCGDSSKPN